LLIDKAAVSNATQKRLGKDFWRRLATAAIGAPTILLIAYLGYPIFEGVVILTAMLCLIELQYMMARGNLLAFVTLVSITLGCFISLFFANFMILAVLILFDCAVCLGKGLLGEPAQVGFELVNFLQIMFGALYIGLPLTLFVIIRHWETGLIWTIVVFVNNWATDGFALIGGRLFGTRKLAPRISAGKTVEGVIVGLVIGFTLGLVISLIGGLPVLSAVVGNLIISVFTILGDLLESWIKRVFGAKDSGSILPGHGGILDRVDGLLVAIPVFFFVLSRF
jgi:phosphatidate cytidylyltransferase